MPDFLARIVGRLVAAVFSTGKAGGDYECDVTTE